MAVGAVHWAHRTPESLGRRATIDGFVASEMTYAEAETLRRFTKPDRRRSVTYRTFIVPRFVFAKNQYDGARARQSRFLVVRLTQRRARIMIYGHGRCRPSPAVRFPVRFEIDFRRR